jgi:hypothetical protein
MSSIKCWNCNLVNFATLTHCRRCNNELGDGGGGQAAYYGYGQQTQQPAMPNPYQSPAAPGANTDPGYGSTYGAPPTGTVFSEPAPTGTVFSEYAPYVPPSPHYSGYAAPQAKLKQGLAIASLTMGIVGLVVCFLGILGSIPGLICGIVAVKKANRNPMEYGGKGMAIAGIVLNGLLLVMIPVIMAIAIPNLFAARKAANEAYTMQTLQKLGSAEATYQSTTGGGIQFGTLEDLERAMLIKTGSSVQNGYKFKVVVSNCPSTSAPGSRSCTPRFTILATPVSYGSTGTGKLSFYMDESYVIRASDRVGMDADRTSPPVELRDRSFDKYMDD